MNTIKSIFIFSLTAILLSSCGSYEKLTYLQDIAETGQDSIFAKNKPGYTLQPGDILYIRVITPDEEINKLFDPLMSGQGTNQLRPETMYYNGYNVSDSGYIQMPVLDTIHVNNLSIAEAKSRITQKASQYLKKAQIIVKMANFRFTVVGEVNAPGAKEVLDDQVNIFEALAYAGDITYNGNRKEVLIIRPTGEGSRTFQVDMTNKDLIDKPLYYIQPNDVIYVKPLRSALFRERSSDYMFLITATSSVLSSTAIILNIINYFDTDRP